MIWSGLAALLTTATPASAQQFAQAGTLAARAGIAAAVSGEVQLAAVPGVREVARDVVSGDPVYLGDKVTTGTAGRLQIMLPDETVFTLGPNAALVIDKFIYDPATNAGKVSATVLQGTFRFVTGKVAKREPSDMEVKLPVGSIGVRGTSVAGETDGTRATIVLLGPGPANDGGDRQGRILVSGVGATGSATTIEVSRPGFGTEISAANLPPSPPVRIDPVRLSALTAPLVGTGPRPSTPPASGSGGGQSGQQAAAASQPVATGPSVVRQSGSGAASGVSLAKVARVSQVVSSPAPLAKPPPPEGQRVVVPDGQTTFEQLKLITARSASFSASGVVMSVVHGIPANNHGSFNYTINVNFGSRTTLTTLTGNYTLANVAGTINFSNTSSFANKTGPISSQGSGTLTGLSTGFGTLADFPRNVNGKVAAVVDVKVSIFGNSAGCGASANCIAGARLVPR
jgi:hypothetical protein